jgi:hypothetical protein
MLGAPNERVEIDFGTAPEKGLKRKFKAKFKAPSKGECT